MSKDNMHKHKLSHIEGLSKQIKLTATWEDLNLSQETITKLREICSQFKQKKTISRERIFGKNLVRDKGLSVIFSGPSDTDKTLAAEIISKELALDLIKINLSSVVSKYIGETEKNLKKLFDKAERASAVLFFDEADALFGKRSDVKDSQERFANTDVTYLLQCMEDYDGLVIFATNFKNNIDEAFIRHFNYIVE
ncbi:MAG: AAA family ATPase [Planctomycetes bacterium]|nr:AAA family ATPase [Planctomycetota bacterium]